MELKNKVCKVFYSIFAMVFMSFSLRASNQQVEEPIVLIKNDWSSQIVLTHITAGLLKQLGYQTELSTKDSNVQWGMIGRGMAHVQMEVWQGTMESEFNRLVNSGALIDLGSHDAFTREDWWYPTYVEELCPGLPDWRALKSCAHIFSSHKSGAKGIYLGGPWEKPDEARIRALGLKFKVVKVKHADELWPKLKQAYNKKKPIILFNWTPNWVEAEFDGKFVEFPEYHPDCESVPEWGENKSFLFDCGNTKRGWLKKGAWSGVPNKWPCAFNLLKNINFNNPMLSELAFEVDRVGKSHQQVAIEWLGNNEAIWRTWLSNECVLHGEK